MQQELIEMLEKMIEHFNYISTDSYYAKETGTILSEAEKLVEKAKSNNAPAVPSVQQGWVEQMLTDLRHVFDAGGAETPQETRDVIEYVASWIAAYRDNHRSPSRK